MTRWVRGHQVVMRGKIGRRVGVVISARVVADSDDHLVLYVALGAPCKRLVPGEETMLPRVLAPSQIADPGLHLIDDTWSETHLIHVTPTGARYSIFLRWSAGDWAFRGWYVNMQTPIRRFTHGIESEDQFLDIVIDPDFGWRWKDEDELTEAVTVGRVTGDEAVAIRTVGEQVLADLQVRHWPFTEDAHTWRPDPGWPIPVLPSGWDED
jgi:hypothetical protein